MARASGRRTPSDDEIALWRGFTRDVRPLRRQTRGKSDPTPPPDATKTAVKAPAATATTADRRPRPQPTPPLVVEPRRHALPGIDKSTARRFQKGDLAIDGRIDLHGMTQADAHEALARFVRRGYLEGRRCLLAITGKGGLKGEGILRQALPRWLSEPQFGPMILAIGPAREKHGGGGAFYLLLRRRREGAR